MASSALLRLVPCNGGNGVVSANRTSNSPKPWVGSRIRFTTTRKWVGSSIRAGSSICGNAVSDKSRTSPWLMLPPSFEETTAGENMKYNFYSLAEDKLISIDKGPPSEEEEEEEEEGAELPDDDAVIVGSSHGWLVMYNHWSTAAMFLSNPLTRRHIKLPIAAPHLCRLSFPDLYVTSLLVSKVVISSSPDADDDGCRAMMTYTPEKRLAFCCPGRRRGGETEYSWTPIGEAFHTFDTLRYARQYEDVVYSARHKLFFCATTYGDFESWDLSDPESPAMTPVILSPDPDNYPWSDRAWETIQALGKMCSSHKFLVVDEKTGQLYHVRRFVRDRVYTNKLLLHYDSDVEYDGTDPYMTVGFDVHRIDVEKGELVYMDGSLGGLAMFVGLNHSFALCAGEFPGVKPDSIYFTDVFSPPYWDGGAYGGHDVGIYNYVDGTISPCYYPVDVESIQRIVPSPMWFTPNYQH